MKRDIYSKLMKLQSAEADALLESKFNKLNDTVRAAKDNDTIYKQLEALEQFIYKVSDKAVELSAYLLGMEPIPPKTYKTQFGPYEGKDYEDIVKKVLELLNRIRYYQTQEVISTYFDLYKAGARKELEDKIRDIAQYNLDALNHIGYGAQLHIIDFLSKQKPKNDVYINFFIEVSQYLVNAEGEAHNMKDENTLVFGFAPLPYNKDIDHIRQWLLNEIERLLMKASVDLETKIKLVDLLNSMCHGPHRGEPSKELDAMLEKNTRSVIEIYSKIVNSSNVVRQLPLVLEIEEKLIFIERGVQNKKLLELIDAFIAQLHEDYTYRTYRVLVGAKLDFFSRKNETYEEAHATNEKERSELIEDIDNIKSPVISVLEEIATYWGKVDAWKLNSYEGFLTSFSKQKPKIAYALLKEASKNNTLFMKFAGNFILGFRNASALDEYEDAIKLVVAGKHSEPVRLIVLAMTVGELTDEDITMATEILRRKGRFSYLKPRDSLSYSHFLMEVFIKLLPLQNDVYDKLFIELLNNHDKDLGSFEITTVSHKTDFTKLSKAVLDCLMQKMLSASEVSYHHQELLLSLFDSNPKLIVEFFVQRINVKVRNPRLKRSEYDAVPYHLNKPLISAIRDAENYDNIFIDALKSFTPKWSIYNSELAELFKRVGGYKSPLTRFLKNAKKDDLNRVLTFFDGIEPIDLDIAVEIVKQTDDKKVWDSVRSRIFTTGMVSGEYGLANEHQRKHDYLKKHYSKSTNKRVRAFVKETLKWLELQVKTERQRTDEELRLRKVDFEH